MRVDVHAHLWTDTYLDLVESYGNTVVAASHRGQGAGATEAELDTRFALMDAAGIDRQVLSVTPSAAHFADRDHATTAARHANDLYAELVERHPRRFAAFAAVPLPHIDAALDEVTRALDDLGMVGVAVTTDVLGTSLADPSLEPFYAELDRRGGVMYVHPSGCGAHTPLITEHGMRWMVGAPVEDTLAAAHLILAGIPGRYPNLKIIMSHLGGALPMVLQRMDNQYLWESPRAPEKPGVAARRLWYDTVGHGSLPAIRAAAETLGADRLVLGTDFPYQSGDLFGRTVTYIEQALPATDATAILDRTAAALLGL